MPYVCASKNHQIVWHLVLEFFVLHVTVLTHEAADHCDDLVSKFKWRNAQADSPDLISRWHLKSATANVWTAKRDVLHVLQQFAPRMQF